MKGIGFLLITVLLSITGLYSQSPRHGAGNIAIDGIITGKIFDEQSKQAMEYANIVLYNIRDSAIISGTITDTNGKFVLRDIKPGKYYLIANFIGYQKHTISDIRLNPKKQYVDLGVIKLSPATKNIDEVNVTADRARIEYKIDKKVVNVSQDISAQGGTAVDALENTPSVQVDIEGNVSLRGSSNFTVLIDGRPSVLEGSDALHQLPASAIENIEIITNPSAKYDPEGVAGIINVVMKKNIKSGINGIVNASIATRGKYSADALLNYRTSKYTIFAGVDYRKMDFTGDFKLDSETYNGDTTFFQDSDGDRDFHRDGYRLKGGFDFYLNDKSTLTFSANYGDYSFGRTRFAKSKEWEMVAPNSYPTFIDYRLSENVMERQGNYGSLNLNYQYKFNEKGHKLDALLYYSHREGDDLEEVYEEMTDADWNPLQTGYFRNQSGEDGVSNDYRLKIDYVNPFSEKGKIEAGYQMRSDVETEKFLYEDYDPDTHQWTENENYSSEMDFSRTIHAVYTTFSNEIGGFQYQLGIRGEYTNRSIGDKQSGEDYIIDRFDFFPSVHVSRQIRKTYQLQASYSRRIDRPRGWFLEPFESYIEKYVRRKGNPELEPEYIDSYELGVQKRFGRSFVALEGYYRVTNNMITRLRTLQENNVFLHTFDNMNKDHSLGVEMMINAEITKWFSINTVMNYYNYRLEGEVSNDNIDKETNSWNMRANATFKFETDTRIQLGGYYRGPSITAQGEREGFFMTNLAVKQEFFKRKLTTTLQIRDIFSNMKFEMTSEGENFYSKQIFTRESPVIKLSISYRINNYKRKDMPEGRDGGMETDFEGEF